MTAEPKPAHPAVHRAHAVQDRDKNAGIVSRGIAAFLDLLVVWTILGGACYAGLALMKFVVSVSEYRFPRGQSVFFTTTGFVVTSVLYLPRAGRCRGGARSARWSWDSAW